jgi:putative hydrolase of the HAD superfamily
VDAAAALDELDALGLPYGGLSNAAFAYQEQKLAACGLARVPMVVGVDTLGFGKPDSRVFALGAERMGLRPQEIAYVGDEYDIDALAASDAGMVGIWLDRPGGHPVVDADPSVPRIGSLAELAGVLARS